MSSYNGHHCWNCWNVSLWIANDEPLYRLALECKAEAGNLHKATNLFLSRLGHGGTPDGARYTFVGVKNALAGLEE